jgi:hypothetical protein
MWIFILPNRYIRLYTLHNKNKKIKGLKFPVPNLNWCKHTARVLIPVVSNHLARTLLFLCLPLRPAHTCKYTGTNTSTWNSHASGVCKRLCASTWASQLDLQGTTDALYFCARSQVASMRHPPVACTSEQVRSHKWYSKRVHQC